MCFGCLVCQKRDKLTKSNYSNDNAMPHDLRKSTTDVTYLSNRDRSSSLLTSSPLERSTLTTTSS